MAALIESDVATEQRVGEFHLYSLPGRSTLLPGQTTSAALFQPVQVKYERNYVVQGDVPYWGFLPQQGEETEPPVELTTRSSVPARRTSAIGRSRWRSQVVPARQLRRAAAGG